MTPYYQADDLTIYCGDARAVLPTLAAGSVQTCVTSPPYFGLRRYLSDEHEDKQHEIGTEQTPDEYVTALVAVFREVKRVLRDDGTLWLNLGDSYVGGGTAGSAAAFKGKQGTNHGSLNMIGPALRISGFKPKNLIGIPWMVAFALRADGWWLRSDIIWNKPSCMPESVTDRPTRSHEYIFLLSKSASYYYDADAIREPWADDRNGSPGGHKQRERNRGGRTDGFTTAPQDWIAPEGRSGRNKRTVWTVPTQPFSGSHFATFPEKLVEPCILAGSSAHGACEVCGAPWARVVEREEGDWQHRKANGATSGSLTNGHNASHGNGTNHTLGQRAIVGEQWRPTCTCPGTTGSGRSVVLDPFAGSGTVGRVALRHNRAAVLVELNPDYIELQDVRTNGVQRMLV
jgi:DNA modification methylase